MCGSMVDIQSVTAEIRQGKKRKIERQKPHGKNIMACPIPQTGKQISAAIRPNSPYYEDMWKTY